jgi:hypothetical protein
MDVDVDDIVGCGIVDIDCIGPLGYGCVDHRDGGGIADNVDSIVDIGSTYIARRVEERGATMTTAKTTAAESLASVDTRLGLSAESQLHRWQQYYLKEIGLTLEELDDQERELLRCKVAVKVRHHLSPPQKIEIWHAGKTESDKEMPVSGQTWRPMRDESVASALERVARIRNQIAEWAVAKSRAEQMAKLAKGMCDVAVRGIACSEEELEIAERRLEIE